MARYIDADELLKRLQFQQKYGSTQDSKGRAKAILEVIHAPTADVEPVRHGRWIETNDDTMKRCSECDIIHLIAQYPHGNAKYCPNCGAKMKEVKE